jgi:4-amino-4-deoxy-L-arabinose transferase-like glycosyltransferase
MILGAQTLRFAPVVAFIERRPATLVALLCVLWMIPGLVGRDPWKPNEAQVFGVVFQLLQSGDWMVPALAGEPWLRNPPLYYAAAAAFGLVLQPFMPLHDAARFVNLLFMGVAFWMIAAATRELLGRGRAWVAPLMLMGCIGLVQPGHQLVPDNALLAAFALAAWGLALMPRRTPAAGVAIGLAIGMAFLAKGIVPAVALLVVVALEPLLGGAERRRAALRAAGVALLVAVPLLALWPVALYGRSPELFREWLWFEEIGRYLGRGRAGAEADSPLEFASVLPWFAWPVLPFSAWSLWEGRRRLPEPQLRIPLTLFAVTLAILAGAHDLRELMALPLLVPLVLLAVPGLPTVPRGAAYALFWFSIMFFLFFLAAAWFYWSAVDLGVPARAAAHMARMEPGYEPVRNPLLVAIAAAATLAWLVALFNVRRSPERPFVAWAIGATAFWIATMTLMVAWVDNAKSYRGVAEGLRAHLPASPACLSSLSLGESMRGLLHYHAGVVTHRVEAGARPDGCPLLVVEGGSDTGLMPAPWELVWEGNRPGDRRERLRLYRLGGQEGSGRDSRRNDE